MLTPTLCFLGCSSFTSFLGEIRLSDMEEGEFEVWEAINTTLLTQTESLPVPPLFNALKVPMCH